MLVPGETGSGKEVIARGPIHRRSRRAAGPILRVNCGAIPPELIDSELFGHERGSFTGAAATRSGWFERADGGTLFLDEIGELPAAAQVRMLRVLQDGSFERVGGHTPITVDVRVVAATNADLASLIAQGKFREDLWYRINVFPIHLPPLRQRPSDIPAFAAHFAARAGKRLGGRPLARRPRHRASCPPIPGQATSAGFGGRDRTSRNPGQRPPPGDRATLGSFPFAEPAPAAPHRVEVEVLPGTRAEAAIASLDTALRQHIESTLTATFGRVEGPFGAARLLGVNPHTLRSRMRKLNIDWTRFRAGPTQNVARRRLTAHAARSMSIDVGWAARQRGRG